MNRIAIRRENKSKWARCAPLVPDDVMALVAEGIPIAVQPSSTRSFVDAAYETAGAALRESIERAHLILGVGTPPEQAFDRRRAWMFFTRQSDDTDQTRPDLEPLLATEGTLLDYDRIVNEEGERLVTFDCDAAAAEKEEPLPVESSIDASRRVSTALRPFMPSLATADFDAPSIEDSGLPPILQRACVAWHGQLL